MQRLQPGGDNRETETDREEKSESDVPVRGLDTYSRLFLRQVRLLRLLRPQGRGLPLHAVQDPGQEDGQRRVGRGRWMHRMRHLALRMSIFKHE